jgi:hypothetical protein
MRHILSLVLRPSSNLFWMNESQPMTLITKHVVALSRIRSLAASACSRWPAAAEKSARLMQMLP